MSLEAKDLKKDQVFWWAGDVEGAVHSHKWSCPAMVISRTETTITILSFDDMKTNERNIANGIPGTMTPTDRKKVARYVEDKIDGIDKEIKKKEREIEDLRDDAANVRALGANFLNQFQTTENN
ncbi:MAG TPA: hypothetical protein VJB70_00215 [Candidatus Paceibacterota bacterium]